MRKYDQFGHWIFVYRNRHKDRINSAWFDINKETLVIDPGVNIFETIYIKGTGDVFFIGEGLGTTIKYHLNMSSNLQTKRDVAVNLLESVVEQEEAVLAASSVLYLKVCVPCSYAF
jgi:hypothetical protein